MTTLGGVTLYVTVAEESLLRRLLVASRQADDDNMYVRNPASIASPCKSAMGKTDFQPVPAKQDGPQLGHLLALRN